MTHFKYVILDGLFPRIGHGEADRHADLAMSLLYDRATSAGFGSLTVENGKLAVSVWGESIGLGLKAEPGDAALILRLFENEE